MCIRDRTTPAHDPNDWAMGERAGLPRVNVFDETAHVVEGYGKFSGMDRDEAREAVVAAFEELGLLDHVEDHDHSVMTCYRCHTKLEPWESEQWFVAVDALKKDAARVVEDGSIQFHPVSYTHLGLQQAHEFWHTAILAPWFVSSALVCGTALVLVVAIALRRAGYLSLDPVSYTHLDVYKRQR